MTIARVNIDSGKDLRKFHERLFLHSLDPMALVGFDGYFRTLNPAWQTILGYTEEELKSKPLWENVHGDDKERAKKELSVLAKAARASQFDLRFRSKSGVVHWFSWNTVVLEEEEVIYLTGHDVTTHRLVENGLKLQQTLIESLARYPSIDHAAREVLRIICEYMDWDTALMWRIDGETGIIRVQDAWSVQESTKKEHFIAYSKTLAFSKGEGLPGLVWKMRQPTWVANDHTHPNRVRAAHAVEAGFFSSFALPIFSHDKTWGVLEFFSSSPEKNERPPLPVFNAMSRLVSEYIEKREIEAREAWLASIVESSENAIIGKDLTGKIISWNKSATRLFQYQPEEVLGRSELILHPSDRQHELDLLLTKVRNGEHTDEYETVRVAKGGRNIDVSLSISPIIDAEGTAIGVATIVRDITNKKLFEAELRRANALQQAILDSSSYMMISTNTLGIIQTFNKTAERLLGYTAAEVVGKSTPVLIHDLNEVSARAKELSQQLAVPIEPGLDVLTAIPKKGVPDEHEWTYVKKDGSRFPVLLCVTGIFNQQKEITGYLHIIKDLSENKKLESALQQRERRYQTLVDNATDTIITVDKFGMIKSANRTAFKHIGYSAEDLVERNVRMLFAETSERSDLLTVVQAAYDADPRAFSGLNTETVCKRKNGTSFSAEVAINHVGQDLEGEDLFIWTIHDITERKRLEKMQSEFISTVSHELRTPLTSISGSLGLLLSEKVGRLPAQAHSLLEIAQRNSDRLIKLINDILDLEKISAGKMQFAFQTLDLVPLLSSAIDLNRPYADRFSVHLRLECPFKSLKVNLDGDRLIQVLTNLLSNAVNYSPPHEEVIVKAERQHGAIVISIIDKGPGIPKELQHTLFQRFVQVDASDRSPKRGTGLGLSICKSIIQKFGGKIGLKSDPGQGSTFYIELEEVGGHIEQRSSDNKHSRKQILHVDDDRDLCKVVAHIIQDSADITFVPTLEEARHILKQKAFDLIIVDITLPDGSGLSLLDDLTAEYRDTPVIVFAAADCEVSHPSVRRKLIKSRTSNEELMKAIQSVI